MGDVIGDLNSRRGRPQGMEPIGAMTEIKAEVPMSEMLTYAPDLRSITAGQGDYTLEFLRYEELPGAPRPEGRRAGGRARTPRLTRDGRRSSATGRWQPARSSHPSPMSPASVCARRLLRGEQHEVFLAAGRPRTVCELCAPRAADDGWVRERDGQSLTLPPIAPAARARAARAPAPAPGCRAAGEADAPRRSCARATSTPYEPHPASGAAAARRHGRRRRRRARAAGAVGDGTARQPRLRAARDRRPRGQSPLRAGRSRVFNASEYPRRSPA